MITAIEVKTGSKIYADNLEELEIAIKSFADSEEFVEKFGEPQIEIEGGKTIDDLRVDKIRKEIEEIFTNAVRNKLSSLDYDNEGEVALYASNEKSEWHDEAVKIQEWIENTYKKMYELQNSVTAENYKDFRIEEVLSEIPKLEL